MNELHELYQELILDHSRTPRNFGVLPDANRQAEGYNPLCGDKVKVYTVIENGKVKDIRFDGVGCAISTASASLMTEILKGKTEAEVKKLFDVLHSMLTGKANASDAELDKLVVLSGVTQFPMRVKCATLPWHTMIAALDNKDQKVSTE
jgi:nitrogen fixation NifU-like protein